MKITTISCLLTLMMMLGKLAAQTSCGITFEYDNAGNRTKRYQCFSFAPNDPANNAKSTKNATIDRESTNKNDLETTAVALYPNPSSGLFQLTGDAFGAKSTVIIWDSKGQTILQRALGDGFFDISSLPAGVYFLKIQHADNHRIMQFIKE